jgi:adenosylcobyric acid synthase
VVINGKVWKTLPARAYYEHFDFLLQHVLEAYECLASRYDVIVMEGAGSVTELNLRQFDLANLGLATRIGAPWLLVADIERGGVFASVIGTVSLLAPEERALLRAFAVNKFRGDLTLFEEGRSILESRTGCPCLGVFPFANDVYLDDEDSLSVPAAASQTQMPAGQRCAIVRFPRISNTTDFRLLPHARWITAPVDEAFDIIFLPGTKNTAADLEWLRERGLEPWILEQHQRGATVIGICGGFQMLGERISDPNGMESDCREIAGLGLLPVETELRSGKVTRAVKAITLRGTGFPAYEIHLGETAPTVNSDLPPFAVLSDGTCDGMRADRVIGTYLHGAFENRAVLEELGVQAQEVPAASYDSLAAWFAPYFERFENLFL